MPEGFDFLGPRVVMVSSFPPAQCGIGRYADQLVAALRSGREVRTVALAERGSGDVQLDLRGGMRILRLLRVAGREDDVVIQWHPHFFVGGNALSRVVLHLAFAALFRRRRVSVVVHEPYDPPRPRGALGRAGRAVQEWARRICWRSPVRLIFHTRWEAEGFARRFPAHPRRVVDVVPHGAFFEARTRLSRPEARAALGLPRDGRLFLCIGFISPHKGFDRAVKAFAASGAGDAHLYLVGSPIAPSPEVLAHVRELHELTADLPRAHFLERYVDDDDFDTWIRAADAVLIPYRTAASSGVIERVRMLGTRAIVSAAGGLAEQTGGAGVTFSTDDDLRRLLAEPPPARAVA